MGIKNKIRILAFNILGTKNVDFLRYLKFRYNFNRYIKYKDRNIFAKKFSESYESEMQIIPRILKNPEIIIDIGANYGTYSFFLSKIYPQAKIFAFEPATSSYRILRKIVNFFNLHNVFPVKKGIGEKEESREIITPKHYTIIAYVANKNTKKRKEDDVEKIDITTLDSFVKRNKIKKIDFIKCDIEGFELSAFRGTRNILKKHKPMIFVEIEERHTKKYGINPQDVIRFLENLGYKTYSVKKDRIEKTNKIVPEIPLYIFSSRKLN